MPFYEVIYETGDYSVAQYDDDEEAVRALSAHHTRAVKGEKFQTRSPQDTPAGPATRIKRVLKYDDHPNEFNPAGLINAEVANKVVANVGLGDQVSVHEATAALRDELSPTVDSEPHESNFKMQEVSELDPGVWTTSEGA
jgi:hypothetical protein